MLNGCLVSAISNFLPYNSVDDIFNMLPLRIARRDAKAQRTTNLLCASASLRATFLCPYVKYQAKWRDGQFESLIKLIVAPFEDFDTLYEQSL
ncbi:MAG: hypothetical protein D6730_23795 [Bacteroidetes bacterium]|nr:MAG: hypothetical protein D6730_23795 [Bacteroidota bacterium]